MKKIGIIGLGNMGMEMAKNLFKSNYLVSGYDVNKEVLENAKEFGINPISSIEKISHSNEIIITMLPNGEIVSSVWSEVLKFASNNTLLVDCSTIDIKTTKLLNEMALKLNMQALDAPVSGGTVGAQNASLTFMVGGEKKSFERMLPIFESMGSKAVLCGPSGSGQGVKMCNNLLLAITMKGVSESFNLAKKLNLNDNALFDVISTSSGSCWAVNNYCPIPNIGPNSPADNNFNPGFSINLMHKDLSLAAKAADECKANIEFGNLCIKLYKSMIQLGKGNVDFSSIIKQTD
jgi:3-hydroxyisobutyrate dehydrogenase